MLSRRLIILTTLLVVGCATIGASGLNKHFGTPEPREVTAGADTDQYQTHIRPLLEKRCTVCHGCYDAPCQLKLDSYEGLLRGANKSKVYDGTRLLGANLTRLFEDAQTTSAWRSKDFFPVINERINTPEANLSAGVMARTLSLKSAHPLPLTQVLPDTFDFSTKRNQQCPKIESFDRFAADYPLWGMPYGLPGLAQNEHKQLMDWLAHGAEGGPARAVSADVLDDIERWETLLNGNSPKLRLFARYIYEHLFIASVHLGDNTDDLFRLVRSSTAPGEPIKRISTRRPFDDPAVARVYYRFWHDPSSRLAKTYLPYQLDDARMQRWREWFIAADYQVTQLPGYSPEVSANPFVSFRQIPVQSRYNFLLDEAQFTIMNFIKGPVCRGQVALNVIQDHFWVFFIAPEASSVESEGEFLADNGEFLQMPAEAGNTLLPLNNWLKYAGLQQEYLKRRAEHINEVIDEHGTVTLDSVWDGDGRNDNAALTIFRHNDSASVVKGLVGQQPKTAWLINYSLLERIHYLLVAGFDVYGNVSHQLLSRLYMDFLRIEGEMNFVAFLPKNSQDDVIDYWYRGAEGEISHFLDNYLNRLPPAKGVDYHSDQPKSELLSLLAQRVAPAYKNSTAYQQLMWPKEQTLAFNKLQNITGKAASIMPEASIILTPQGELFSLLRNSAHSSLTSLLREDAHRLPGEDGLTVTAGIIGAYPNSFWLVEHDQLSEFVTAIGKLNDINDYQQLKSRYGISRSDPNFWQISDQILALYHRDQPQSAGLLDYNRLENR
ncbi:fatty acid cis/trans isomerase [Gilvimarinus polysaccharolyticus]|uniref:fatty acid cis/trans isomerase n=1 Tax=Gilvimarinus polysaccharolyticus TaxID=863921 RepID=UPI000673709E|nr:fatty acid cis/trans isomerase [Gilvimarinus polysaccharolyticus]